MNFVIPDVVPAIPEIFMLAMTCIVLLSGLFLQRRYPSLPYMLSLLALVGAVVLTVALYKHTTEITFHNSYIIDHIGSILKVTILGTCFFVFLYCRRYVADRNILNTEFYVLCLFSVLGMMVLVSAYSFISLYLGLEIFSLPLYALIALQRDAARSAEAAMKYFIMGAVASGMLLYGLSMIYGATKSVDIAVVSQVLTSVPASQNLILVFGLVFVVVGVAFKLGGAPFHMWVPDVYEGAPSAVTLFIATAPKIAAFAMAVRLLVDMMPLYQVEWQHMLIVVALVSMAIGNFVAIVQTNLKRMLAYSSIAHMGYMSLGLLSGNAQGYSAASFYIIVYTIMSLGAFGMVTILSGKGFEMETINDYKGLNSRNPWLAFIMLLLMFSMAGVPPIAGFFAKLGVIESLVEAHLVWLAVLALVFAIIGAYYYLRVVKVMYFDAPEHQSRIDTTSMDTRIAISANGLFILVLGIFPGIIFNLCKAAF
ncbi:MAG: NADH-quinone oxidoreductase subunit NuoN [Legionellales bacterium]|mgnify:CR=1 FL=1|nr:NADH-quinone oxidoreductase subunit NuoN [Legionellales bacterium]|tara:strand:+ start:19647 stop:21086 length:1440 start_codon:yes stop_codon:yes gene_type:complete